MKRKRDDEDSGEAVAGLSRPRRGSADSPRRHRSWDRQRTEEEGNSGRGGGEGSSNRGEPPERETRRSRRRSRSSSRDRRSRTEHVSRSPQRKRRRSRSPSPSEPRQGWRRTDRSPVSRPPTISGQGGGTRSGWGGDRDRGDYEEGSSRGRPSQW